MNEFIVDDPANAVPGAEQFVHVAEVLQLLHDADEGLVDDGSGAAGLTDDRVAFAHGGG